MNALLILYIAAAGLLTMAFYTVIAKWEQSRAGRAYFLLFLSLTLIAVHFVFEGLFGQAPYYVESILLVFVAYAVTWNLWTILWKKYGRKWKILWNNYKRRIRARRTARNR